MFGLIIDYRGRMWKKAHGMPAPWLPGCRPASGYYAGGFLKGFHARLVRPYKGESSGAILDLD